MEISSAGKSQLFAQLAQLPAGERCPGGIGLTLALGVLPGGWVIVGSLPTTVGGALPRPDSAGCLIVLDDEGDPVETIASEDLDGPWDLAVSSTPAGAFVFVSNALGDAMGHHFFGGDIGESTREATGDASIVRLDFRLSETEPPKLLKTTVIGTGFPWTANSAALDLAPTGLALYSRGTLYVDDADTNTLCAIPRATSGSGAVMADAAVISSGGALDQPLGMTLTPNSDFILVNGNDGNAVELSPSGRQLGVKTVIRGGAGDLIGLSLTCDENGILLGNDATNTLDLLSR